jgi:hypothetical protein
MKNQSKTDILKAVSDLLDQKDCVVRLQRDLVPDPATKPDATKPGERYQSFKTTDKVTFIIVATKPKETN